MTNKIVTQQITLDGGAIVTIPVKFEDGKCRGCPANDIVWAITKNGKPTPIRWNPIKGWISHFSDCPTAITFRKTKENQ